MARAGRGERTVGRSRASTASGLERAGHGTAPGARNGPPRTRGRAVPRGRTGWSVGRSGRAGACRGPHRWGERCGRCAAGTGGSRIGTGGACPGASAAGHAGCSRTERQECQRGAGEGAHSPPLEPVNPHCGPSEACRARRHPPGPGLGGRQAAGGGPGGNAERPAPWVGLGRCSCGSQAGAEAWPKP